MTPHKHAEVIKAWADGAQIELRSGDGCPWAVISDPSWAQQLEYRIAPPQPKSYGQVLYEAYIGNNGSDWRGLTSSLRAQHDAWAAAVIAEYKRREQS